MDKKTTGQRCYFNNALKVTTIDAHCCRIRDATNLVYETNVLVSSVIQWCFSKLCNSRCLSNGKNSVHSNTNLRMAHTCERCRSQKHVVHCVPRKYGQLLDQLIFPNNTLLAHTNTTICYLQIVAS
jgi:hypothetical protein